MIPAPEAEKIILDCVKTLDAEQDSEIVTLETATGRVLAQDVASDIDFPYWDNSAMDGYAVRYADFANYDPDNPATLDIVEEIPAGYPPQKSLEHEALKSNTLRAINGYAQVGRFWILSPQPAILNIQAYTHQMSLKTAKQRRKQ